MILTEEYDDDAPFHLESTAAPTETDPARIATSAAITNEVEVGNIVVTNFGSFSPRHNFLLSLTHYLLYA